MRLSVRVVRVFADGTGRHGNPLGVILNASALVLDEPDRDVDF